MPCPDGELLVNLDCRVVAGSGIDLLQLVGQFDSCRVEDAPVTHSSQDSWQQFGLLLTDDNGSPEEFDKQALKRCSEPRVESSSHDRWGSALQIPTKRVLLAGAPRC